MLFLNLCFVCFWGPLQKGQRTDTAGTPPPKKNAGTADNCFFQLAQLCSQIVFPIVWGWAKNAVCWKPKNVKKIDSKTMADFCLIFLFYLISPWRKKIFEKKQKGKKKKPWTKFWLKKRHFWTKFWLSLSLSVKLLSGPSLAFGCVITWAKWVLFSGPSLFFCLFL